MPNVYIPSQENEQAVIKPIVRYLADNIKQIGRLGDVPVIIPSDQGNVLQANSALSDTPTLGIITSTTRLFITTEVKQNEELLATNVVYSREHMPLFIDRALKFSIRPVYVKTDIVLTIKFISNSKTEALRWLNETYVRMVTQEDFNLHTFKYHFPVSAPLLKLIKQIHTQREAIAGYGDSLEQYMIKSATGRLNVTSDITGSTPTLIFTEAQTRIIGQYDNYPLQQNPDYDKSSGTYSVEIPYKVTFDNPVGFTAHYPIIIHNQILPDIYIPTKQIVLDNEANGYFSRSMAAINRFELQNQLTKQMANREVILPEEDDFTTTHIVPGVASYLQALCSVEDSKQLLNINDLNQHYIDEELVKFIISERDYVFYPYKSIVHIAYYKDESLCRGLDLRLDEYGAINSTVDLSYRSTYRFKFCIVIDFELLDPKALERLKPYPNVLMRLLGVFNAYVLQYPSLTKLSGKKYITASDINSVSEWLQSHTEPDSTNNLGSLNTVTTIAGLFKYIFNMPSSGMKTVMRTNVSAYKKDIN